MLLKQTLIVLMLAGVSMLTGCGEDDDGAENETSASGDSANDADDKSSDTKGPQPSVQDLARRAVQKKRLADIGLAMHKYHNEHKRFPNHDSNGSFNESEDFQSGFSWRVYILPQLGHQDLYDQFQHDEPWDSEANKALIEKMPEVFKTPGVTEPGQTSVHLFVRQSDAKPPYVPPFGSPTGGPGFRNMVDGSSNTILAVAAGPDKAEYWTKPGGLMFDPDKNPLDLLGDIPDEGFYAVFFDGSVAGIKPSIKPVTLRRLIANADGEDVGDFPTFDGRNEGEQG